MVYSNWKSSAPQQSAPATMQPTGPVSGKKKSRVGLGMALVILIVITFVIVSLGLGCLGPKNLGVHYTQADIDSVMEKTDISRSLDGMTGKELDKYLAKNKKKLDVNDYDFDFSDYRRDQVTLTQEEASAFLDNIAPGMFWFSDVQVRVNEDGTMAGSSRFAFERADQELFGGIADQLPFPVPGAVNIYAEGHFSIHNNKISATPSPGVAPKVGPISIPEEYLTPETVDVVGDYTSLVYTCIPDLIIYDLYVDNNGMIVFDGIYPHTVTVTKK